MLRFRGLTRPDETRRETLPLHLPNPVPGDPFIALEAGEEETDARAKVGEETRKSVPPLL
jgi:hypothetical protein